MQQSEAKARLHVPDIGHQHPHQMMIHGEKGKVLLLYSRVGFVSWYSYYIHNKYCL